MYCNVKCAVYNSKSAALLLRHKKNQIMNSWQKTNMSRQTLTIEILLQGVQTLSVKSNLLILPVQSWSIYDSLGSNWPQDKGNLHTGCKNQIGA